MNLEYTIDDIFKTTIPEGLNAPDFSGESGPFVSGNTPSFQNTNTDAVGPDMIGAGQTINQMTMADGYYQSSNFVSGSAGWQLTPDGDLEANSGTFRGTLSATTGTIGGFNIGSDYIRDVANSFGLASTVTGGDDVRFFAGAAFADRATAPFRVTEAGAVTASSLTVTGGTVQSTVVMFAPLVQAYTAGEAIDAGKAVYVVNRGALDLESGSSQYASIADASQTGLDLADAFSLEAQIKLESVPTGANTMTIMSKSNGAGSQEAYRFFIRESGGAMELALSLNDGGGTSTDGVAFTFVAGTEYHVAVTSTAPSRTANFYVNGASIGSKTYGSGTLRNSTAVFSVGCDFSGAGAAQNFFDGVIDEVRVWDDERTSGEIGANDDVEIDPGSANLRAYYRFNNSYIDETSNNNALTASGSPTFVDTLVGSQGVRVYLASALFATNTNAFIGFSKASIAAEASGNIILIGEVTGLSGLTLGSPYYLSNTRGEISTSVGTITRKVGIATGSTTLLVTNIW